MSKLLDKIKKLYEKAQSAEEIGNLEEANAFLNKVKQLCEKHNFAINDVEGHSIEDKQNITHVECKDIRYGEIVSDGDWDIKLMGVIARGHFCNMFINWTNYADTKRRCVHEQGYFTLIGTPDNIELCRYLYSLTYNLFKKLSSTKFNELRKQAIRDSAIVVNPKVQNEWDIRYAMKQHFDQPKFWDQYGPENIDRNIKIEYKNIRVKQAKNSTGRYIATIKNPESARLISYRKIWIRSYLSGAVYGLQNKFDKRNEKVDEENTNQSLIVANAALIRQYMDDNFNLGSHKSKSAGHDSSAYDRGIKDGKGAHLASGVSKGSTQATKLLK